ncbi:MAG: hypothetical protein B7Z58_01805 [Acidiphilium sp. 37-64-53]|uniref:hypothetical protein n=1 Tax=Acidiphilium TaxID=522 RepID=UPI000BCE47C7|nr:MULTISPECIES: hypothetical protein [Acidiphilium]OYW03931.1 MAG: hypothetical protein B7Z58_01805 [Acidiphilium sp. 37-64-53]OZB21203.1 MAG: hypothetical protein B7X49_17975 [Acidiphilium sp. 34-64-41]HQT83864.1 hypothetical protein [Acidiphilium rubrum]
MTSRTATEALLDDLRERAWRGDAEAQRQFVNIGAKAAQTVQATSQEIDKMITAKVWRPS